MVTSITPEPVVFANKKAVDSAARPSEKGQGKVMISRKELGSISRVAEKISDLHQVAKRYESFNKLKT